MKTLKVQFSFIGHSRGEAIFHSRADLDTFIENNKEEMLRYSVAPCDGNGNILAPFVVYHTINEAYYE